MKSIRKAFKGLIHFFNRQPQTLIRVVFALAVALVLNHFTFDFIESYLYDLRIRMKPVSKVSGHIETIAIDPETIDTLKRTPNALDHSKLLEHLREANAKVVIYLLNPSEVVGSYDELEKLADQAGKFSHFYIAISDVWSKADDMNYRPHPPFDKLTTIAAPHTSDQKFGARDDVTRRMLTSFQGDLVMQPLVAALYNPEIANEKNVRGIFSFYATNQIYIDFRPSGTYPVTSFYRVSEGNFDPSQFRDKIVLIGRDIQATAYDYVRTPFSREVIAMSLLELHANMLDTLILNSAYEKTPSWLNFIISSLISVLTVYVVLAVRPSKGLMVLGSASVAFSLICFLLFWLGRWWVDMSHPVLSIFVCYYFFIPYRLIIENRRSWEYFQKNRLLTQVEELKTNFLSMMSHDLKTPLARIQGMTDVALQDPNPLSDRQRQALTGVRRSSEELVEFISSILNLGRIESNELKLHMSSKDPNQLLEEIIVKSEDMAKQKSIEIQTEFEPMFSVKMDVDLMRQVFTNLIENAIKYSPDKSRILISTEEQNGKVVIQIADQGMGIPPDEIGHVFLKFYRVKGVKSSDIKGSGLGLYLAKYFVELHQGQISVDSQHGQGSTFTVELPQAPAETA